jgi:hypothetical protein
MRGIAASRLVADRHGFTLVEDTVGVRSGPSSPRAAPDAHRSEARVEADAQPVVAEHGVREDRADAVHEDDALEDVFGGE